MSDAKIKAPTISQGEEWLDAKCMGCGRTWNARGTINCRRLIERLRKHANRMGHVIDIRHTNAR